MDNLTHSLVGALLGQMGLKRKTGLAMPTLIIAANIPDVDAVAVLLGGHQHLAIRRGITHGPIAMVVLPLILWAIMLRFNAWQTRRGKRPEKRLPVHKGWLLGLAYIGCLSHPLFDWMNSYGIRLLEPFSSHWFYGDSIFIIDVWILLALGLGVWLSRRRERSGKPDCHRPAVAAFGVLCAYILANGIITGSVEANATKTLQSSFAITPDLVVANPVPVLFWRREILWRGEGRYGTGQASYGFNGTYQKIEHHQLQHNAKSAAASLIKADPNARAFLFWSRMPVVAEDNKAGKVVLTDQRFLNPMVRDRFKAEVKLPVSQK